MSAEEHAPIRIATRASALALWQAQHVAQLIRDAAPGQSVDIVHVSTVGDRDRTEPLSQMGGMGVFTREVQKVVLDGAADVAVHSLKDLPTDTVEGLALAGIPGRAPRFDALILPVGQSLATWDKLAEGARIGTGSLRRQAQLLHHRPDLQFLEIRGNVETRLRKLDEGEYDAIILAEAGLTRLELAERISLILQPPIMFPAVGQAALGIECRAGDRRTVSILERISDQRTKAEVLAERALLRTLRAGCHAPVASLATVDGEVLKLTGIVLSPDGRQRFEATLTGEARAPEEVGRLVAEQLVLDGAAEVL